MNVHVLLYRHDAGTTINVFRRKKDALACLRELMGCWMFELPRNRHDELKDFLTKGLFDCAIDHWNRWHPDNELFILEKEKVE
jgi:hypothetical protein